MCSPVNENTRHIRIVLQARTTSCRLPAKVLLPIGGLPLAILCAHRLANQGHEVVLATSREATDNLLASIANKADIQVFRGSLDDVLDRFLECMADLHKNDLVIRATADNPLPDGTFITRLIAAFEESNGNYLRTSSPTDGLPYGLSAEVFRVGALREMAADGSDAFVREHVTVNLRRQAGFAGIVPRDWFIAGDYSDLRVTIDNLNDYLTIAALFQNTADPVAIGWWELVERFAALQQHIDQIPGQIKNGVYFSSIMLGTAQLGFDYGIANHTGCPDDAEAYRILSVARKSGVSHLDTARVYGNAEVRIGRLETQHATNAFSVVTKLHPLSDISDDASVREVFHAVDASVYGSCRNLRRTHIDTLLFHRSVDMFRWEGAALTRLIDHMEKGVVGEIGVSVYAPEEAIRCLANRRITHLQLPFNLLDSRWLGAAFQQLLKVRPDLKVHVRSVFLQGVLLNNADVWPKWVTDSVEWVNRLDTLRMVLKRRSKADLCMAYVRSFPWATSLVLGVETATQLDELLMLAHEPPLTMNEVSRTRQLLENAPERLLNPSFW